MNYYPSKFNTFAVQPKASEEELEKIIDAIGEMTLSRAQMMHIVAHAGAAVSGVQSINVILERLDAMKRRRKDVMAVEKVIAVSFCIVNWVINLFNFHRYCMNYSLIFKILS